MKPLYSGLLCILDKMVSLKFIFFACALLVAQTQAHPQTTAVKGPVVDIAKLLVPIAEKYIDIAFTVIDNIINVISSDTDAFQKKIMIFAGKGLDQGLDLLNSVLDKIKAGGDKNTVKVISCIENSKEKVKKVSLDMIDVVSKCEVSSIKTVLQDFVNLESDIQNIKNKAFAAANGIQKCSGDDADKCAMKVAGDVFKSIISTRVDILFKIAGLIGDAVKVGTDFIPKCVIPNTEHNIQEAYDVMNSISVCMTS